MKLQWPDVSILHVWPAQIRPSSCFYPVLDSFCAAAPVHPLPKTRSYCLKTHSPPSITNSFLPSYLDFPLVLEIHKKRKKELDSAKIVQLSKYYSYLANKANVLQKCRESASRGELKGSPLVKSPAPPPRSSCPALSEVKLVLFGSNVVLAL